MLNYWLRFFPRLGTLPNLSLSMPLYCSTSFVHFLSLLFSLSLIHFISFFVANVNTTFSQWQVNEYSIFNMAWMNRMCQTCEWPLTTTSSANLTLTGFDFSLALFSGVMKDDFGPYGTATMTISTNGSVWPLVTYSFKKH